MPYEYYPRFAEFSFEKKQPRQVTHFDNFDTSKKHYIVEYKFWENYGIFRVEGNGPSEIVNRKDMRKLFTAFTREKAPQNWYELIVAFAEAGFIVIEVKVGKTYEYKHLVI